MPLVSLLLTSFAMLCFSRLESQPHCGTVKRKKEKKKLTDVFVAKSESVGGVPTGVNNFGVCRVVHSNIDFLAFGGL